MVRARRALVAVVLAALAACGDDEPSATDPPASTTTSTSAAPTTETSSVETVQAVLASRLRGEYPGINDTHITVDGDQMGLHFVVGAGETPGDALAFGQLAAQELLAIAPELLDGITEVTVRLGGPESPEEETFMLWGQLLSSS
jgi:ABC-type glycerol-3-phosphate transport system substrate-binding protein